MWLPKGAPEPRRHRTARRLPPDEGCFSNSRHRSRKRQPGALSPVDFASQYRCGNALEHQLADVGEAELSSRPDQIGHQPEGKDLTAARRIAEAPGDHDRGSEVVAVLVARFPRVQADPNLKSPAAGAL